MEKKTPIARERIPPAEIESLLRELDASQMSVAQFARERSISPWRLYEARRRTAGKKRRRSSPRHTAPKFVPVEIKRPPAEIAALELVLSSGHRLRVPPDFDEASLRRLMGVLASC